MIEDLGPCRSGCDPLSGYGSWDVFTVAEDQVGPEVGLVGVVLAGWAAGRFVLTLGRT